MTTATATAISATTTTTSTSTSTSTTTITTTTMIILLLLRLQLLLLPVPLPLAVTTPAYVVSGKSGSSTNPLELVGLGECLESSFRDKHVNHCSSAIAGVQDWTAMAPNRWTGKSKGTVALQHGQNGQRWAFKPDGIWNMPVKSCEQVLRNTAKNNMFHILFAGLDAMCAKQPSISFLLLAGFVGKNAAFFLPRFALGGRKTFQVQNSRRLTLLFPTFPRRHVVSRNRSGKVWQRTQYDPSNEPR